MPPIKQTSSISTHESEKIKSSDPVGSLNLEEIEHLLEKQNWALSAYSKASLALTHAQTADELCQEVSAAIVTQGSYVLSWVGLVVHDEIKSVRVAGSAGSAHSYAQGIQVSWDENSPYGQGPTGVCIRSGRSQVVKDALNDEGFTPWRARASQYGIRSAIAIPIFSASHVMGTLMVYSKIVDAFGPVEITLFENLANEIGYGLKSLERQESLKLALAEREKAQDKLLVSLRSTIEAMSRTMEWRDPYTAGHQKRVANIAAAIAHEMNWDEDRIQGLYMGAMVHDIGKVGVPSEILTKPTRLTSIEMKLVEVHPETGYQILKDLPFSWPIADMIRQHHEHMDGSGYPLGLKGEEILPEARVLAVADVIEAMSSHRPYRPARGMDAAIAEVKDAGGKTLDQEVVEAALRVVKKHPHLFEPR
jgi:putative nucleotidyltransferase with HDIG domain